MLNKRLKAIIILTLILYNNLNLKKENKYKYKYCFKCIKKINNLPPKCSKCPTELILEGLKIVSTEDTIKEIIQFNKSISRYGDGEFSLIFGISINFQEFNERLSKKLLEILNNNKTNLLVGIFYYPYKKNELLKILNKKKKYYSADITRFYSKFKNRTKVPQYIKKLKKIWMGRNILIVEGEKTRLGIGNDLFNNTKSIKRIICPSKNSFRVYDKILDIVLKFDKNMLILISLGPTATVLAYDLSNYGYQTIDIGHTDIQYELFLRYAKNIIQIPFKFVNEYNFGRNEDVGKVTDVMYYKQIVYNIF